MEVAVRRRKKKGTSSDRSGRILSFRPDAHYDIRICRMCEPTPHLLPRSPNPRQRVVRCRRSSASRTSSRRPIGDSIRSWARSSRVASTAGRTAAYLPRNAMQATKEQRRGVDVSRGCVRHRMVPHPHFMTSRTSRFPCECAFDFKTRV